MVLTQNQRELFEKVYSLALKKFKIHMENMHDEIPYELTACDDGEFYKLTKGCDLYDFYNWTTSFVTGLAPLFYLNTKNDEYLKWADGFEKYYHNKVFETPLESMHDMGFLYILYSVAMYKVTGDKKHREDALKAADELAKRFNINGCYIDAWNKMDEEFDEGRAIVDSMMNLSLFMWAWKETGHSFYKNIATSHAQTTRKYFVREDGSVAHSYIFDAPTGKMIEESNTCGYANGSWWARGTAWAVYGFSLLGEYMENEQYSDLSKTLFENYKKALTKESKVPVWDFRLPKDMPAKKCGKVAAQWDETLSENTCYNVDTSACAIMACALLRMCKNEPDEKLKSFAIESVEELCRNYINEDEAVCGLLHHQNGNMTYTTFGDYFLAEALSALLFDTKSFW